MIQAVTHPLPKVMYPRGRYPRGRVPKAKAKAPKAKPKCRYLEAQSRWHDGPLEPTMREEDVNRTNFVRATDTLVEHIIYTPMVASPLAVPCCRRTYLVAKSTDLLPVQSHSLRNCYGFRNYLHCRNHRTLTTISALFKHTTVTY